MFDLYPHQQEVDLANYNVTKMVPTVSRGINQSHDIHMPRPLHRITSTSHTDLLCLVVLKFYVQTVFDAHLHLEGVVHVREVGKCVHSQVQLFADVSKSTYYHNTKKIPKNNKGTKFKTTTRL